jgi:hypothetical protein
MEMGQGKNKKEVLLQDLITMARRLNIEVRTERLMREVGYRAHSGRCRFKGQELIIIDRDAPLGEQVDFLAAELCEQTPKPTQSPPQRRSSKR